MKKTIFIIAGVLIFLIVAGVWAYLFVFGTPESVQGVFTRFGIGDNETPQFEMQPDNTATPGEDGPVIASRTLRQLSTTPIAGMMFIATTTVRYAEQGTGHIFDISLETGSETQVSNTTFVKVRDAVFSPDGTRVILSYEEGGQRRNTLGTLDNNALTSTSLISAARDFAFDSTGETIYYLLENQNGTNGYAYDIATKEITLMFTVPFGSARAIWGDEIYVYQKPAASLPGYLYKITDGALVPVTTGRFGLMATPYEDGVIVTETEGNGLVSTAFGEESTHNVPLEIFREKCAVAAAPLGDLICGGALSFDPTMTYPDDWYKGVAVQNDLLWSVDIAAEEATLVTDPLTETGRMLDVEKITANQTGTQFLIMNKTNSTLWLFTPNAE